MKRTLLFIFLALASMTGAAEDSIPAWRFAYEYRCEKMKKESDLQFLDVTQKGLTAHYYSVYQKEFERVGELAKQTDNLALAISKITSAKKGEAWEVFWNIPNSGNLTFVTSSPSKMQFTEDYQKPEWTLKDETREVCGYQCKRAEADYRGRHWTAWYAEELPLPFGPWELGALPGLILEANGDSLISFKLVGAENVNVEPFKIDNKKYIKTSRKEYNHHLRLGDADRISYLRDFGGYSNVKILDKDGNELKKLKPKFRIYLEKLEGDKDEKPEEDK